MRQFFEIGQFAAGARARRDGATCERHPEALGGTGNRHRGRGGGLHSRRQHGAKDTASTTSKVWAAASPSVFAQAQGGRRDKNNVNVDFLRRPPRAARRRARVAVYRRPERESRNFW
ncbi:Uncharacterized protein pbN1_19580 [Aromatoleum bremense]|nr:Uncharacterized protein pbN1_19580 [Aromatoleum bremense]